MQSSFEQLVKMQMASDGVHRSMPRELDRDVAALCKVLDRKFAALRDEAEATRRKLSDLNSADHSE